jgi:hypothetical protein
MTFRLRVAALAAIGYLVFAAKQKQPSLNVTGGGVSSDIASNGGRRASAVLVERI